MNDTITAQNIILALIQVIMFLSYGILQKLGKIKSVPLLLCLVAVLGLVLMFCFSKLFPNFSPEYINPFYMLVGQCVGFIMLFFLYRKGSV